jgi:hypothetical protein
MEVIQAIMICRDIQRSDVIYMVTLYRGTLYIGFTVYMVYSVPRGRQTFFLGEYGIYTCLIHSILARSRGLRGDLVFSSHSREASKSC